MSSDGELHIDLVHDLAYEDLNKVFGENNWTLSKKGWYNLWGTREFPKTMEIDILDDEDNKIGEIQVINSFEVVVDFENYIEVDVENYEIKDLRGK